jgi:hypothetical protein
MEQYYFTFYCDELCVDLQCVLEYEEAEPEVGLKDSMTLISAIPKMGEGLFRRGIGIMKLSLVDEIEAAALKDIHDTEMDF